MRVIVRLSKTESEARAWYLESHPDDVAQVDGLARRAISRVPVTLVDGIDLEDADGSYLYTLEGQPR